MKKIPWAKPDYWGNEIRYVNDALESTWISGGSFVDRLEEDFKKSFGMKHMLAVSNGTTAIHLAFLGLDIQRDDEIIVPGFGFLAAANIAQLMGARPVFAEVDKDTWCMDARDLERRITHKTKAIVPVHTYGNVCDLQSIMEIAVKHEIPVVEDCAESLFSRFKGRLSGVFGKINTFSFQATKTITTGEGGLVATNDDALAEKMALYRSHGMNRQKVIYWHEVPGHNFRLTNLQAALGVAQLEKIDKIISSRKKVYKTYLNLLENTEGITLQKINPDVDPVIWAVALKLEPDHFPQGRDKVITDLLQAGIETRPGFYASSLLNIYEQHDVPVCVNISRNVISLPSYPTLKDEEIALVCENLLKLRHS